MRTPETSWEVAVPQENSNPRTTASQRERKASELRQPQPQAGITRAGRRPGADSPWEGTEEGSIRPGHCPRRRFGSSLSWGAAEGPARSGGTGELVG